MELLRVLFAFLLFGLAVSEESTGCPTLSVSPCICTGGRYPVLECDRVSSTVDLKRVFVNSAGAKYDEVRLTDSVLQYIPHDLFDGVEVNEFHLINNTFVALFDETPQSYPSLHVLSIVNTRILRHIDWKQLQAFENLRTLTISSIEVNVLGEEFAQYAPKSLEEISFHDTKTVRIEAGVFEHFRSLDKVAVDHSQLNELNRNMFPVPFNVRHLSFDENQLRSIPTDMFSDMPDLRKLSLKGNRLTTLARDIFKKMNYLNLEGNPLRCNCGLAWLMKHGMQLKGACATPITLYGRRLVEVYRNTSCRM